LKSKNQIVLVLLATLLVSTVFASFANADDKASSIEPYNPTTAIPPDDLGEASETQPVSPDSSTRDGNENSSNLTNDGNVTGTSNDLHITSAENDGVQLISTNADAGADNTWIIFAIATVLAVGVGGAFGVVFYRKKAVKVNP
jgi:hypothetical protein